MMVSHETTTPESMEEHCPLEVTETSFTDSSDICQELLDRYGKSSAAQHRHLCATAAATRSIIQSESLPLSPLSYFLAAVSTVSDASLTLDSNAISALASFLAIVLSLVPEKTIVQSKAAEALSVLVELVERRSEAVSTASGRAVVKCLGLLLGSCDLEDWNSVKLGLEKLLKFSTDRRPKLCGDSVQEKFLSYATGEISVRRCAQDCVVKVFKSFESHTVIKKASKSVLSLLQSYMPLAVQISASGSMDLSKDEILSKPEYLEVIHMLTLLKHIPYLSVKVSLTVLSQLQKLMNSQFSALTRHTFCVIKAVIETSKDEVLIVEAENIIKSLTSYVSLGENNPTDTILAAANLLKIALDKLRTGEASKWIKNLPLVFGSIAGLLTSEATALQASDILKELINFHITRNFLTINIKSLDDECSMEEKAVKSTCAIFEDVLCSFGGMPNQHSLEVISVLFQKLGDISHLYMKVTLLKLADTMSAACGNKADTKHLEKCIGSAIIAMGPEKILFLIPIKPNAENPTSSNLWLIPILRNYVVGSSLGFFMEHVVPLAKSFQHVRAKVKKSVVREGLQDYARDCWGLLPAFCRYPTDTYQNFGSLANLLITLLTNDSSMLENIGIALQDLVNQNKRVLRSTEGAGESASPSKTSEINISSGEVASVTHYSKKMAIRNIRALSSCSKELLQVLIDVFLDSPPEKRAYLKDAIGCLASVTDSSVTKSIFILSMENFQLIKDLAEFGEQRTRTVAVADQEPGNFSFSEKEEKRCLIVELAASLIEGAGEDLIASVFDLIKQTLQESDEVIQSKAYHTLSIILEEHSSFTSSHDNELMDFLLGLKPPVDIKTLRKRFACFQILLVHTIKRSLDEENSKAFLVLNEIILTMKDSTEEARKAAYDMLLGVSSSLQRSSATSDDPYQKFISMIMGYLSGSSPHIKSGAVSALSVLVHNNAEMCLLIPDLVPSVLALLQTKAVEVIKAVLGFVKVLVSCLQANDLQNFLPDIVNGVLQWSSVSRHHFRTKVTVILEIVMRKCGAATVKLLAPEKHKNFLKSVLENRHGKTSSKKIGATDPEGRVSESSPRGSDWQRKRKHEELGIPLEQDGKMEPRSRKWEKKRKGFAPGKIDFHASLASSSDNGVKLVKEPGKYNHARLTGSHSRGSAGNKRNFNRTPTASRNTEMKRTKVSKKFGATTHRPGAASKLAKHKKDQRKQQKN